MDETKPAKPEARRDESTPNRKEIWNEIEHAAGRVVADGDYITVPSVDPIAKRWRGKRGRVMRWVESVDHYEVIVEGHKILLAKEEMIITEDDPRPVGDHDASIFVGPDACGEHHEVEMRSIMEIREKVRQIRIQTMETSWKTGALDALLWVLKEREEL